MKISANQARSVLKALTWRLIATTDTIVVAFLITGSFEAGLLIGGIEVFTKIFIYYCHERAWSKVKISLVQKVIEKITGDVK